MARLSRRVRPALVGLAALGAAALLIPPLASATPSPAAPPDIASVQKQLDALAAKNEMLVEQFDHAQVVVAADQKAAHAAHRAAVRSQAEYARVRVELSQTVTAQYEGGSFSATGALLSSPSGQSYLDQLDTLSLMSAHTAQMIARAGTTKQAAKSAQHTAATLLASATAKRDKLADQRVVVQKQIDKYTTMLSALNAAQRAAFQRAHARPVPAAAVTSATAALRGPPAKGGPGGSALARQAVSFALAQVGKPYVFAASGPDAYDCSGLTMAAWGSVGVALPHSAADQYNYGTHVSLSELQPGDLIFMYQPIGHVEMYIGNGMVVSAPQPGENVLVLSLASHTGEVTGATRLP